MICSCGGRMAERVEDGISYLACAACLRTYAPDHRTEGAPVQWAENRDKSGVRTFLLPGETEITGVTMRRRVLEYYAQIPDYHPTPGRLPQSAAPTAQPDLLAQSQPENNNPS